jgi:hypothetical protein
VGAGGALADLGLADLLDDQRLLPAQCLLGQRAQPAEVADAF